MALLLEVLQRSMAGVVGSSGGQVAVQEEQGEHEEQQYLGLIRRIMESGNRKGDRWEEEAPPTQDRHGHPLPLRRPDALLPQERRLPAAHHQEGAEPEAAG